MIKNVFLVLLACLVFQNGLAQQISQADIILIDEHIKNAEAATNDETASSEFYEAAYIYYSAKQYSEAKKLFIQAEKKSTNSYNSMIINNMLGNLSSAQKNNSAAVSYFEKALSYAMQTSARAKNGFGISNTIAEIELERRNTKNALAYYMQSLDFAMEMDSRKNMDLSIENIQNIYQIEGNSKLAQKIRNLIGKPSSEIKSKIYDNSTENQANNLLEKYKNESQNWEKKYIESTEALDTTLQNIDKLYAQLKNMNDTLEIRKARLDSIEVKLIDKENQLNTLEKILQNRELALTISFGALALILILAFFSFRGYRIKKRQHKLLQTQKQEIEAQAHKLNESNSELNATLDNLRSTQAQLVQSEKMASLGQLIAGIAHELNTPLGAVKSSIGAVKDASEKSLSLLPELIQKTSAKEFSSFLAMLNDGLKNTAHFTSREERAFRKKITQSLEDKNIEDADEIAETLVDIGIRENPDQYIDLLKSNQIKLIMQTAYYLAVQNKNSENIITAVNRAAKIIYALRSYSHTTGHSEKVKANIVEGIDTVFTIYHNQLKHGITIEKQFNTIPEIACYPDELNQVWTNLIHNAIQAMNSKGTLTVSAKKEADFVIVSFADSGTGIPENIRDRIFEPFFTTKAAGEGTGLGLDIIKKIIDRHNGEISFETETGKGTTFFIKLPII